MDRHDALDVIARLLNGDVLSEQELRAFAQWASDRDDEAVTAEERIAALKAQLRRAA